MKNLTVEKAIRLMVGIMIFVSLSLAFFVNKWWLGLAAFVGINLIQSVFTGVCPAEMIFKKLGLKS